MITLYLAANAPRNTIRTTVDTPSIEIMTASVYMDMINLYDWALRLKSKKNMEVGKKL